MDEHNIIYMQVLGGLVDVGRVRSCVPALISCMKRIVDSRTVLEINITTHRCRWDLRPRPSFAKFMVRESGLIVRGTTRAGDAQGTPAQSHISPSILVHDEKAQRSRTNPGEFRIVREESSTYPIPIQYFETSRVLVDFETGG